MSDIMRQHFHLTESATLLLNELDHDKLASDILSEVVLTTIRSYQQKISVGIEDSISDQIDSFKQKLIYKIIESLAGWRIVNQHKFMFPRNCRFAFSKGQSVIFVVEQEPQIRSMSFFTYMLNQDRLRSSNHQQRIALAMPYMVFIIKFRNNQFSNIYCGWRGSPLQSMNDTMSPTVLPNIHTNMQVCTGQMPLNNDDSMSKRCEDIISNFWNSTFNDDLSEHWWQKSAIDERIASADAWKENGENNPLFILDDNIIDFFGHKHLNHMVSSLTQEEDEPDLNTIQHKLSEEVDQVFSNVFSKILSYFKKTKFEKYHPKDIKDELTKSIKHANNDIANMLVAMQHELGELKLQIQKDQAKQVRSAGINWQQY